MTYLRCREGIFRPVFQGLQTPVANSRARQRTSVDGSRVTRCGHQLSADHCSDIAAESIRFENYKGQTDHSVPIVFDLELVGETGLASSTHGRSSARDPQRTGEFDADIIRKFYNSYLGKDRLAALHKGALA